MVGRPKKVINRLVEKWEHEFLLKVMARKIQRAKPTLTGKTSGPAKPAKSTPALVSPSRRPSIQVPAGSPLDQLTAHVAASACPDPRKKTSDKPQPGAPLIAELERAANGSKGQQLAPGKAAQKPPWKGPMDDTVTDFGCGFDFDELPAGPPQQRRKTFAGFEDSDSWDPLPRPIRPSATPQTKPPVSSSKKPSGVRNEKRKPVLIVVPIEPVAPLGPKPRLSKPSGNSDGRMAGDVSKRAPLAPLQNAVAETRPVQASAKKTDKPPSSGPQTKGQRGAQKEVQKDVQKEVQKAIGKEEGSKKPASAPEIRKTVAADVEVIRGLPSGPSSSRKLKSENKQDGLILDGEGPPKNDTSPRQTVAVKRMPSSKIPRPRGTPGDAVWHKARQSLRLVRGGSEEGGSTAGKDTGGEEDMAENAGSLFGRMLTKTRYEEDCEEDFPVHQAESAEFLIRTPSSGIDQPLTSSEEATLERQAQLVPAMLFRQETKLDGTTGSGTALQREIAGLNQSLEAMKEALRGMNGKAVDDPTRPRSFRVLERRVSRGQESLRSTKSDASNVSSQGLVSEDDDTCRTGESDDEGGLRRGLEGLILSDDAEAKHGFITREGRDSVGLRMGNEVADGEGTSMRISVGEVSNEDLDLQIAHQKQLQEALLHEIAGAKARDPSLEEHQKDFLSESQGDWAVVTGEESHVANGHVSGQPGGHAQGLEDYSARDDDEYEDDFEGGLVEGEEAPGAEHVEGDDAQLAEGSFDVEGEELMELDASSTQTKSPRVGFAARLSYQVDGVRGSREESLPESPDRATAHDFPQLTARGTKRVPDMQGLTAEIEKLEQEMQRLKR